MDTYEVVIIGAGQSGLSVSYYLTKNNINHIIVEKESVVASSWNNQKWDSFTLVTPNSMNKLPDTPCVQFDEHHFLNKKQVCNYIKDFANSFNAPMRFGVNVTSVFKNSENIFEIRSNNEIIYSQQVVIATSSFNEPNIPLMSKKIKSDVIQIHSSEYKNPESIVDGSILVVGTAQSGAQIIDELVNFGRKVFSSTSKVAKSPRRYRGKDISLWARLLGQLDKKSPSLLELKGKHRASPQLTGKDGGREIHLQELMRKGLVLLGRLTDTSDTIFRFKNNLNENMHYASESCREWTKRIDQYIIENKIDAPESDYIEPKHENYDSAPETLLIQENNINTIIWATGYKHNYSWISANIFDEFEYPITNRGITDCEGLCFVGMPFMERNKTSLLYGISEHAKYISEYILKLNNMKNTIVSSAY